MSATTAVLLLLLAPGPPAQEASDVGHAAYRAQMAAAEAAMRLGEHADARIWLDETDPARRGFLWRVLDARLDQSLETWAMEGRATALATSPDGRTVACGLADGTLSLRDARTLEELARARAHDAAVAEVRFDRAGARLVTSSYDRTARVWSAADLAPLATYAGHVHPVGGVDFSADGALVASSSYERPDGGVVGTVDLWDAADGALVVRLEAGRKPLVDLAFAPDGGRLAAASWDFCAYVWDLAVEGPALRLPVPDEGIYNAVDAVAWSPDGALVAGASKDRTARVWDARSGALAATLRGHTDHVAELAFAPGGAALATASSDGTLKLWSAADWSERATLLGHADDVLALAFAPGGERLWSSGLDGTVRVWDATTDWYGGARVAATDAVYVVRFSPDGHRLASCSYDGRVQLWSADTLEPLAAWQAHPAEESCHALDWSPDGRLLYSGSHDGTVGIWDSVTLEERGRLAHGESVHWLDASPDGRLLAACSGGTVRVWDAAERRELVAFEGHSAGVLSVAFSPDSRLCASAGRDGRAIVWEAGTGAVRYEVSGVGANVAEAAFTHDGEHLVVGGRGGHVALHRADDGAKVRDLVRNRHGFSHIAVAPDGELVALAADTVTFVDARRGGAVGRLRPHVERPYFAAFDARGERLASCSTDGTIVVADTRPLRERLARAADARRRIEAAEAELGPTPSAEALRAAADRLLGGRGRGPSSDPEPDRELDPAERAARVEVLTRRAQAAGRAAEGRSAE